MQQPVEDEGLTSDPSLNDPQTTVHEVPGAVEDDRSADLLEAHSIKWNVARIVRLSSGRFALLTHYRAGTLDIIKVGTIEEIIDHIPTYEQCATERPAKSTTGKIKSINLADLGL